MTRDRSARRSSIRAATYPEHYNNGLFFSDYARQCLFVMPAGTNGLPNPAAVEEFSTQVGGIVDLEIGPGGDLYYLDILAGDRAPHQLRRTGNQPADRDARPPTDRGCGRRSPSRSTDRRRPTPTTTRSRTRGISTATARSTTAPPSNPSHTYTTHGVGQRRAAGPRPARADERRAPSRSPSAANALPVPMITAPPRRTNVADRPDDQLLRARPPTPKTARSRRAALDWSIVLFHCPDGVTCHQHLVAGLDNAASGSFIAPDHEYLAYLADHPDGDRQHRHDGVGHARPRPQTRTITMHSSPVRE